MRWLNLLQMRLDLICAAPVAWMRTRSRPSGPDLSASTLESDSKESLLDGQATRLESGLAVFYAYQMAARAIDPAPDREFRRCTDG